MNYFGVLTTHEEYATAHLTDYIHLRKPGTYRLHLDCRAWGKRMNLICFFTELDTGKKFALQCWRHGSIYNPKRSDINFAEVRDGTNWLCTVGANRNGNPDWVTAEPLEEEP